MGFLIGHRELQKNDVCCNNQLNPTPHSRTIFTGKPYTLALSWAHLERMGLSLDPGLGLQISGSCFLTVRIDFFSN
jgi:hypothetical protein